MKQIALDAESFRDGFKARQLSFINQKKNYIEKTNSPCERVYPGNPLANNRYTTPNLA